MPRIYSFDPLRDVRWARFLDRRAEASIFHTPAWIEALRRTYGYEPVAYTSSPPEEELADGLPFCRISTWLSGKRLVSLPFSDHVAVLVDDREVLGQMFSFLSKQVETKACKYVEIRPAEQAAWDLPGSSKTATFYWHRLSLDDELEVLYKRFHSSCVRRAIRRAERDGLTYMEGREEKLIQEFYRLLLLTHRRHGVPPQPISWFRNLVDCLGDNLQIRAASLGGTSIASIITLTFKGSMVYKYGCSDARYHNSGGMALLMWRAIQDAKGRSLREFDFGRSDSDNAGLVRFKDNWGAERTTLAYWGYPERLRPNPERWDLRMARGICARLPVVALPAMGKLLYKHMG